MYKRKLRIVFMGTPDFAVPALDILVKNNFNVVGVITATDKVGGRNKSRVIESAVKKYAVSHNIPVLQPKNLKAPEFIMQLRKWRANLQVVVAFRMLPEMVWNMPRYGTFNLHGSLLPKYRGAAPINWAIIQGEKETGVTSFFIKHEIDTGDVIMQERLSIGPDETAGELHDRMMLLGAEVVLETVKKVQVRDYQLQKQDDQLASKAPKIFTETCEINFDRPTQAVHDFIRGLSPYPASWTTLQGEKLKIYQAEKIMTNPQESPGQVVSDGKSYLRFSTQDGYINVLILQLQGRKRMDVKSFLNGYSLDG